MMQLLLTTAEQAPAERNEGEQRGDGIDRAGGQRAPEQPAVAVDRAPPTETWGAYDTRVAET